MAKKKAAVKKVGSKVTPKKAGSRKQLANPTSTPLDSSVYVKFENFQSESKEQDGILTTIINSRATKLDCDSMRYTIYPEDIEATLNGENYSFKLVAVDQSSPNRSEANVIFVFSQLVNPERDPGVRETELVITVLTKKTRAF